MKLTVCKKTGKCLKFLITPYVKIESVMKDKCKKKWFMNTIVHERKTHSFFLYVQIFMYMCKFLCSLMYTLTIKIKIN